MGTELLIVVVGCVVGLALTALAVAALYLIVWAVAYAKVPPRD